MGESAVVRARRGDFTGLNLAGLVRSSVELGGKDDDEEKRKRRLAARPMGGRDIRGPDEQEKDCREYADRGGANYVFTYEEPDTSAFKKRRVTLPDGRRGYRVIRPVFADALNDLRKGVSPDGDRLDGLIVYDVDRLTRDNRDLEDAIEIVQHFGRPILDYTGTLDLLTDNGRTVARILVATANKQSADTARRVARKHRALEQAGIPTGGSRPFGWNADKRTLHSVEAPILRAAAGRLLEGAPISSIPLAWNRDGVLTPAGKMWNTTNVRTLFHNPRLCGYRARTVHEWREENDSETRHKEIVVDAEGAPVIGQWEPILTPAEWEAINERLAKGPARPPGHNTRKHLYTGTLRCGKPGGCGGRLRVMRRKKANGEYGPYFYCCKAKSEGGCGGIGINGPAVDRILSKLVLAKYAEEAARNTAPDPAVLPWGREVELEQVREDMAALTEQWRTRRPDGTRTISNARYFGQMEDLENDERALVADRKRHNAETRTTATAIPMPELWYAKDGYTLAEKRAYIERVLTAVIVGPALTTGVQSDDLIAARLDPAWRE
jgi:site-specific DNA recombinase